MFTDPFPSNERPIVARVCFCGVVFTESLLSKWAYKSHKYIRSLVKVIFLFSFLLLVFISITITIQLITEEQNATLYYGGNKMKVIKKEIEF